MADITLTGTIVDSDSTPWANARVSAVLMSYASPQGQPKRVSDGSSFQPIISTNLDNDGALTLSIPASNNIAPHGTQWGFVIQPNADVPPTIIPPKVINLNGDISSWWNSIIQAPRLLSGNKKRAYNATEIEGADLGDTYINTSPSTQGTYMWNGTEWVSLGTGSGGFTVSGTPSAPHPAFVPIYESGASDTATWGNLTQADIIPAFAVTEFAGGQTVEIGADIVNPAFTLAYTQTPASASVTNTDGIDSPLTLSSPFTAADFTGTFVHNSQAATTFTVTAIDGGGDHASANAQNIWLPRNFAGVGGAGATGASASGNNANLTGASGTLNNAGLSGNIIGTTFGPLSPSGQKIYVLTTTNVTVWHDAETGLGFAMNAPTTITFVNQHGASVSMFLYESSNTLTGTFEPQAIS